MPFQISNEFWGIGGFVVGTIGILVSIFVFFIGRKRTLLEYQILTTRLFSEDMTNIQGLEIQLNGHPIKNLKSTTVRFINSGNQTIVSTDFAKQAPLKATVSGSFLGDENCYHILSDNPNCAPLLKELDNQNYLIEFDFLKPRESFEIDFLHSGSLLISGELKSGRLRRKSESNRPSLVTFSGLIAISTLITALINIIYPFFPNQFIESVSIMSTSTMFGVTILLFATLIDYKKIMKK